MERVQNNLFLDRNLPGAQVNSTPYVCNSGTVPVSNIARESAIHNRLNFQNFTSENPFRNRREIRAFDVKSFPLKY